MNIDTIRKSLHDYEKMMNHIDEDKLGHKYETKFYRKRLKLALKEVSE